MKLTAGTALQNGKYLINHVAGQSSVSLTLQGTQTESRRPVILQTLQRELQADPGWAIVKQRFQDQISRFAQCHHPGLVRLIHSFEADGLPFAVLDYTPGQTLAEVVQTSGVLPEELAIRYIQQVGAALMVLHQHNLVHQQIAPPAIVRPVGSEIVVLVNVALATPPILGISSGAAIAGLAGLSEYAAIEQYPPQLTPTPATDLYALAATLYFLLTGHPPIAAPRRSQTPLPTPRQLRSHLSLAVETAILRGLELNPNTRPATIGDWLSLLPQAELSRQPAIAPIPNSPAPVVAKPPTKPGSRDNGKGQDNGNGQAPKVTTEPIMLRPPATVAQHSPISPPSGQRSTMASFSSRHFPKTLMTVATVAAAIGLGAGFAIRIAATSTGPGASFFNSEQSFPPIENWSSQAEPVSLPVASPKAIQTAPIERELPVSRPQLVTPPPQAEVVPAPPPVEVAPASPPTVVESPALPEPPPSSAIAPESAPAQAQPTPPLVEPELPPPQPISPQ